MLFVVRRGEGRGGEGRGGEWTASTVKEKVIAILVNLSHAIMIEGA